MRNHEARKRLLDIMQRQNRSPVAVNFVCDCRWRAEDICAFLVDVVKRGASTRGYAMTREGLSVKVLVPHV